MKIERYFLAELKLETALHIGVGKAGNPTDSPLRRRGDGRLVLPGRALGGALRTMATRLAPHLGLSRPCKAIDKAHDDGTPCGCMACQLFGELYPSEDDDEADGAASKLWISDALIKDNDPWIQKDEALAENHDPQTHVRDGVGIARDRGAAARNVKFDQEVVPRGAVFEVRLKLVEEDKDADTEAANQRAMLLAAALAEWEAGRGRLGSGAARGLGRFALSPLRCVQLKIQDGDQLVKFLKTDQPWAEGKDDSEWWKKALSDAQQAVKPYEEDAAVTRGFVTVECTIALDGPFLINDPLVSALAGFDHAPLLEVAIGEAGKPVMSGSSLRGALRSRAEKIARTLATIKWQQRDAFLLHCPACDPLARDEHGALASCDVRSTISTNNEAGADDLCLACRLFGSPRRGSRLWIEDAPWAKLAPDENTWHAQDFLAIDRFTGGGQDGAKFDAAPLTEARFRARLTLHDPEEWELGWLALVLRDLAEGEITIGFGAAKGYGRAKVADSTWTFGGLKPEADEQPRSGIFFLTEAQSEGVLPADWLPRANGWVTKFNDKVIEFKMPSSLKPPEKDSFFDDGQHLVELYGLPHGGG